LTVQAEYEFATSEICLDAFRTGLMPDPLQTIDEWLEAENVQLPSFVSEAGKYRVSRTPFWREVYECLSPSHPCHEVALMKSHQIGATTVGVNWLGYIIDRAPAAAMVVEPTVDLAKKFSKQKLQPMLDLTPCLKGKVREARTRDSGNTVLSKEFVGGLISLTGSNSAVGLRFASVKYLLLDEVDGYVQDADGEGHPVELAENRTSTFARRKIFKLSTPLQAETSVIEPAYLAGSRGKFHVPCPFCLKTQWLRFAQLIFTFDGVHRPERTAYRCEHCQALIEEHHKSFLLEYGTWVHEDPENPVRSFHINALYMPYGWPLSWAEIARRHLKASKKAKGGDQRALKAFVNTILAETWQEKGEKVERHDLMNRRETYAAPCPDGVLVITAAVDVQDDRLECEKVGWGVGEESWSLGYKQYFGKPSQKAVWDEAAAWLQEPLTHECGVSMAVQNIVVDTGGHYTQEAYEFVKSYRGGRICAGKGSSTLGDPIVPARPSKQKKSRLYLWLIGTVAAKDTLFPRMQIDTFGPGYIHFPDYPEYDEEYFEQLTSEEKVQKYTKGVLVGRLYKKTRSRNEALDLKVYNMAALKILNPNLEKLAAKMQRVAAKVAPAAQSVAMEQPVPVPDQPPAPARTVQADRLRLPQPQRRPRGFVQGWR
jgi:phage terminase large subunit GpA-like protein